MYKNEIVGGYNTIDIEVSSDYPSGGDGGLTTFRLKDTDDNTGWEVSVNGHYIAGKDDQTERLNDIEIKLRGTSEFETFLESLKFAVRIFESIKKREIYKVREVVNDKNQKHAIVGDW